MGYDFAFKLLVYYHTMRNTFYAETKERAENTLEKECTSKCIEGKNNNRCEYQTRP